MRALFLGSYPNEVESYRSTFFQNLIFQFAEMGIECHVISCVSITKYKKDVKKIQKYRIDKTKSGKSINVYHPHIITYSAKKIGKYNTIHLTERSFENACIRQVKKLGGRFDFVYGHFFLGGGLAAAKIGKKFNIPAYIAYGECDYETEIKNKFGDIKKKHVEGVSGIIAVSSKNYKELVSKDFSLNIPKLLSVNCIDSSIFYLKDKIECRKKFDLPKEEFIVGFVGYFIERKGVNRVLKACEGLDYIKLAFAGKGEQQPQGENVVFCKGLLHEEVADFLNAVDIFVLPTLNEGCCNAVVEAMACGKAIVSSNLPFNLDVLNDNNSILVDPNNVEEIRKAIIELYENKTRREKIAKQALDDAKLLTIEQRAENILNFIIQTSVQ